jgi:hypothetical protein
LRDYRAGDKQKKRRDSDDEFDGVAPRGTNDDSMHVDINTNGGDERTREGFTIWP